MSDVDLPGTALGALKYASRRDSEASALSAGEANSAAAAAATIPNRPRIRHRTVRANGVQEALDSPR